MARILFVITEDWALLSHRLHLVKAAIATGHHVGLATRFSCHEDMLSSLGVETYHWGLTRKSLNPFAELKSLFSLHHIISDFQPDLVHAVAQKPVLYTGVLKRLGGRFGFVAALGGIGYIFSSSALKARLLRPAICLVLRFALAGKKTAFILQNQDNISLFEKLRIVCVGKTKLVRGSGVEVSLYQPKPLPKGPAKIILPARMLWDKGVAEFIEAARRIKAQNIAAEFILVGDVDTHNAASVTQSQIDEWVENGIVQQWGRRDDMPQIYPSIHIVCLPSYHEGLPKVLMEAASCGRPVIAFDVPGSREIVQDGVNGFLVPFQDQNSLENALLNLIHNRALCTEMGREGRKLVEEEFSDARINQQTFNIWAEVLKC